MFKLLAIVAVCCIQAAFCARQDVCPCGWSNIGNKCFKFITTAATWDVARKSCQDSGGDLVIISSLIESNLLASEARKRGLRGAWLGYFRPRYQSEKFLSVCGVKPAYENWAAGEPNDSGNAESCAYMKTTLAQEGQWNDARCTGSIHYICEFSYLRCN